jgi:hypothetical protein
MSVPAPVDLAVPALGPRNITLSWGTPRFFVAGGYGTNQLSYSINGNNWTASTSGNSVFTDRCYDVAFGNDKWVAAGFVNRLAYSTDGINWTNSANGNTIFSDGHAIVVAYGDGKWFAGGYGTNKVAYSTDGINWTASTSANSIFTNRCNSIAYGNGKWVAGGMINSGLHRLAYSTDGITWTLSSSGTSRFRDGYGINTLLYANGIWVAGASGAGGWDDTIYTNRFAYSTDGITWNLSTSANSIFGMACYTVAYGNGKWVLGGWGTSPLAYSTNGINWTEIPIDDIVNTINIVICYNIAYVNGLWVLQGAWGSHTTAYSSNGINWTRSESGSSMFTTEDLALLACSPPVTGYRIQSTNHSLSYTIGPNSTIKEITGLMPSTTYNFTIETNIGGSYSAPVPFGNITTQPPPPPTSLTSTASYTAINLYWTAPSGTITGYRLSANGTIYTLGPSVTTTAITDLSQNTSYTFTIQTDISGVYSTAASFGTVQTPAVPQAEDFSGYALGFKELQLSWSRPGKWVAGGAGTNKLAYSKDGINWTAATGTGGWTTFSTACYAVAYGNDKWVAGGFGTNTLAYSTDGEIWFGSASGNSVLTNACTALAYGSGRWVAGGSGTNRLAYSTDGIDWTGSTSGNSVFGNQTECKSVAYANGLWVAGSSGTNRLAYSTDGINWNVSTSGNSIITSGCYAVAYGNGKWVAGGQGTYRLAYSTDGINWTGGGLHFGNPVITVVCRAVAYGNGKWVAGGEGTNQLAYSYDGINWTGSESGNLVFAISVWSVAYANGKWVAGGDGTNRFAYSTDGINWTGSTSGNSGLTTYCLAVAGDFPNITGYVLQQGATTYALGPTEITKYISGLSASTSYNFTLKTDISGVYSDPLTLTFSTLAIPAPRKLVGGLTALRDVNLAWTPRASWVAAGAQGIVVSNDGMIWTLANNNPFTGGDARRIAWNGLYWIAVGGTPYPSTPYIARSSDGLTWTLSTNNPFSTPSTYGSVNGIGWNGTYWIAVGSSTDSVVTIAKSTDGLIWTPSTNNPFPSGVGYGIAWNGTYWLAGGSGDSGTMAISSDGMNWTPTTSLDGNDPFIIVCVDAAWNGTYWVASGSTSEYSASTAKSADGINWVSANPFPNGSYGIAWNGSYWVAIGANADPATVCIVKSTDGATWTPSTNNPFTGGVASGIAWNGTYWIATGNNGANTVNIAKSLDGMTWTPSTNNFFTAGVNDIAAGGINITGYRVTSGGTTYDLTETSKQLTDLTVGTTYNFTVQTDISGEYSLAQSFPPITPIDTVPAPVNLFGYPGVRTANLEWSLAYPYLNVTGYRIHNGGTTYTVGPNKKTTITGLDISAAYSFTIETDISGVYSSTASFGTLTTFTPSKPSGLASAPASFTSLSLTWNQPVAWVAVGDVGIVRSADGTNWTPAANNPFGGGAGIGVAYNGSYWVAVGNNGDYEVNFAKSIDGITWTPSTNNPFGGVVSGIAWNGSYWVAVGDTGNPNSNTVAKSTDGMTWTGSDNLFSGGSASEVAWNGSYWIAVGSNDEGTVQIAKSVNGLTWTDVSNNPFTGGVARGIAWNGSYWAVVGSNIDSSVCIAVSTDGITWTPSTNNPFSGGVGRKVAYGGGLWVAVGQNGSTTTCIATSIDGMNWTPSNNNPFPGNIGKGIAWNGSYWVATGNNAPNTVSVATSTDGMNWTANFDAGTGLDSVGAGPSFTVTGYRIHSDSPSLTYNIAPASSRIITGLSGTYSFTIQTDVSGDYSATAAFPAVGTLAIPAPNVFARPRVAPTEIQYYWNGPAMYVAGGETENRLAYSFDGINWLASVSGNSIITTTCYAIGYANGLWVAGGQGTSTLAYSTDGIVWTGSESGTAIFAGQCFTVAYGNGKWVAGGSEPDELAYSTDGINWTTSESGSTLFTNSVRSVAYGNGIWVAGGQGVNQLAYSADGINWTASESGNAALTYSCNSVAYGNGRWVAAGGGEQQLAYSTDGMNWTVSDSGIFSASTANIVAYGNIWVAGGGEPSLIAYSRDGINWTPSENGNQVFATGCYGLTYINGIWVAVGYSDENSVAYSTDGINWTASTSGAALFSQGFVAASAPVPATFRLNSVSPSLNYSTTGTTLEITGLTTLTDYSFTVTTDLSGGLSAAVPFRTVKTSARPLPVSTLTSSQSLVGGELNLTFSWTDPNDYAYFYVYSLRAATGTKNSIYTGTSDYGTLSHTFTGLDPGRTYTFTIRRGNDAGYSNTVSATSTAVFFDPRTVTGLKFWVDAADTAGDGSNVADGTTVTTWYDKSGTTNNATGSATLRTDSTGRYMDMSGSSYDLTTSSWIYNEYFNVFMVDKQVGYGTLLGATAASTDALNIAYDASGIILSTYGDHSALGTAFQTVTAPVNIWCFSNYGGKTAYWNKLVSGKDYSHAASFVTDSLLKLGTYSGKMREVLIYTGVMAEDNRAAIQNYLYTKWFTQPNLIPLVPVDNGCVMWLDATDITTVFQDVNGTVPVTGDAQTVLRWNDKSGYENHMDVSGVTPQYNAITFDGLPGINTFGNIDGTIQTAPFLQSGDASLFLVAYITGENTSSFGYFKHDISGNFGLIGNPNISWKAGPSPNNNIFVNAPDSVPFLFYGTMKKDQLLEGTFVNSIGIQKSYSVEGINVSVTAAPIQLNGVNSVVYGEVIYYNRALTAAEVQQNATYLSNKWRIPIPAEAPFSPPAAPGLKLWLDSADPYTVFEDASGLTIWKDRSGLGNNAMPHGSLPVSDGIVFGGSQYLSLPDGALPQGAYSYYAVAKFVSDSTIIHGGSRDISGQMWLQPGPGPNISYSYDGVTFATAASVFPDAPPCNAVVWNGSYWLAGAEGSGDNTTNPTIAKSLDGFNWTLATDGCFAGISYSLVWGGDQWVNGGYNFDQQSCIRISPDGLVWTPSETPPFGGGSGCYCNSVAYNGTYWVAVGTNQNIAVGYIAKSTDGITWIESTNNPIIGNAGGSVVWTGTIWLASGENGNATSSDGMDWTITTLPFPTVSTIAGPAPAPVHNSSLDVKTVDASGASYAATTFDTGRYEGGGGGVTSWVAGGQGTNMIVYSTDGETWTASTSGNSVFTGECNGVAYGNSMWVAGGSGANTLAYSTDGETWTASENGNSVLTERCIAVAYGNGKWVAGGSGTSRLAYSTDGIDWVGSGSGNSIITLQCLSVAYGNGKWVAGGYGGNQMAYSTDGETWTASESGNSVFTAECYTVKYGNSIWVAGGAGTNQLAYSADGETWTASESGNAVITNSCSAVAYGNGKWVAGGYGSFVLAYSTDGETWTGSESGNSIISSSCFAVAYGNGKWVAGSDGINTLAYSTDGETWTASESGNAVLTDVCNAVAGIPTPSAFSLFTEISPFTETTAFVPNISTLTDTNVIPLSTETTRVPGWVAVGNNIDSTVSILKSTDGLTWTASTNNPFSGINGRGVAWNGSYWLAVGANTGYTVSIAKSTDGLTWTDSSGGGGNNPFTGGEGYGLAWNGSYWVAVGNNTGNTVCIAKSLNGLTWTAATNNPFSGDIAVAIEIAWNGSYWLSVGCNNENTVSIAKSTDGLAWTDSSGNPFSGGQANGIAWNGSYWIAVGVNSDNSVCIAKSTNGMDWTASTNNPFTGGVDAAAYGIAWNGSYWIAVGNNTGSTVCIAKSTNGMDWTDATDNPFSGAQGYKISWNGSYWIAVGQNTGSTVCIAKSTNGMDWTVSTNNPFTGGAGLAVAPGILTLPHTQTVIIESLYNGTGRSLFLNGITGPTDTSSRIQDASNNFIGWDMSGNYMNGTIKEIIVYSAAHTATQRQQVEAYLKAKWYPQTYSPSSMALWLDSTTLTPGRLQTWPDRSGHSDLSQNAIWAQPLCSTDAVTGRQGVQFAADGIANGFTATPFGTTDSWSVFSVQRYDYSSNQYAELENNVCTAYETVGGSVPAWVVVGNNSDNTVCIASSTDGVTWTPSTNNPFDGGMGYGIGWNGSYWIAVGNNSDNTVSIAKSTDGDTWIDSSGGGGNNPFTSGTANGIAWNGSYWIAVGNGSNGSVAKSSDGMTWTISSTSTVGQIFGGVSWNGSYWIAVGNTIIIKSSNGEEWTPANNNPFYSGQSLGVAWNGSYWIAVGNNQDASVCIAKSTDGMTWTPASINLFYGGRASGIAWNGSYWLAVGVNTLQTVFMAKSTNGMDWTIVANPFSGFDGPIGISWNGSYWFVVGTDGTNTNSIAKSTDGITWTLSSNNPFSGGAAHGIASGSITFSQNASVGTDTTSTPSVNEIQFTYTGDAATAEIHKTPVLVEEIVNASVASEIVNSTLLGRYTAGSLTNNPLRIGFTGSLTPSLRGAMRGYIYEMIIYNRIVAKDEQQVVEGYLSWKWGVPLPTTHPYYIAPPTAFTPFTPLQIAGCQLWLDGADTATIDLSGTTVIAWADKSSAGNNAAGVGGLTYANNTVVFDGSSGYFTTPYTANPVTETVFIVMKYATAGRAIIDGSSGQGNRGLYLYEDEKIGLNGIQSGPLGNTTLTANTTFLYGYTINTDTTMYYNGSADGNGTTPIFGGDGTTSIGAANASSFLHGTIQEILVYNTSHSTADRQRVEGYLATKWGLQSSLPVNHPYYLPPPVSGPFTPLSITGCQLWLDGVDDTTMNFDIDRVTSWDDKSPLSNDATCFGNFTYSNGLVFDGSTSYFTTPYTANPVAETVFIVMRFNTSATTFIIDSDSSTGERQLALYNDRFQLNAGGEAGPQGNNMIPVGTTILYDYTLNETTNMYYNGSPDANGPTPTFYGGGTTSFGVNNNGGYNSFLNGTIKEIIIYNKVLGDSQRIKVEGYLATKWGLRSSLPSWHPYYLP